MSLLLRLMLIEMNFQSNKLPILTLLTTTGPFLFQALIGNVVKKVCSTYQLRDIERGTDKDTPQQGRIQRWVWRGSSPSYR